MDESKLEALVRQYIDQEIEVDTIESFCENMIPSVENKNMLIECVDSYDLEVLFTTLFRRFKHLLTADEEKHYRKCFKEIFDSAIY